MEDFLFTPLVIVFGLGAHAALLKAHTAREGKLLTAGFLMHIVGGFAQVLVTREYFRLGDLLGYWEFGALTADVLRIDFFQYAPELLKAFLQQPDFRIPAPLFGGGSTLSMCAAASFILFLSGNSIYASCVLVGICAYVSKVLLYHALRVEFPQEKHPTILAGVLLLPSAVFWSSAILKEPLAMVAIGPLVLAMRMLIDRRGTGLAILMGAPAVIVLAVIKPYILMSISIAGAAFLLVGRLRGRGSVALKPFAVIPAIALGLGGLVLGSRYFVKLDGQDTASAFAGQRRAAYSAGGGSAIDLGDASSTDDIRDRSLAQELAIAPLALATALFRPVIFEARNMVQLVTSFEMMVLLVLFAQGVRLRGWRGIWAEVRASPALLFCLVMTLSLGLGTGLSSPNLGTLSRYRTPMMPFFFALLLLLRFREQTANARPALAPLRPLPNLKP